MSQPPEPATTRDHHKQTSPNKNWLQQGIIRVFEVMDISVDISDIKDQPEPALKEFVQRIEGIHDYWWKFKHSDASNHTDFGSEFVDYLERLAKLELKHFIGS
jgi:hypothetical protein